MRFLLGLFLTLIAASGLVVSGFVFLSTLKGPTKPTVPSAPKILIPREIQAKIHHLSPLTPPPAIEGKLAPSNKTPKQTLPFVSKLPAKSPAKHLVLTSLPPSPLEIRVLNASKGQFAAKLHEGCYQVRGFSEGWAPLFTMNRFCLKSGTRFIPAKMIIPAKKEGLQNLKRDQK